MTRSLDSAAAEANVSVIELETWVHRSWLRPRLVDDAFVFDEVDIARAKLICEFRDNLAIDDDALPIVLDLMDRLHAARARLRTMLDAVAELPPVDRDRILARIFED